MYAIERQLAHEKLEQRVAARTADLQAEIAERKRVEASLEKTNAQVTDILESINDAFFALDDTLTVIYFNQAAERVLGRDRREVMGQMLFDAFPEARGSIFEEKYRLAIREKQSLSFETFLATRPTPVGTRLAFIRKRTAFQFTFRSLRNGYRHNLKGKPRSRRSVRARSALGIFTRNRLSALSFTTRGVI